MKTPFRVLLAAFAVVTMVAFAGCGKDDNSSNTNGNDTYIPIPGPNPQPSGSWVDLGLPSGLLWAECNVGAVKPEDFGSYFAWGETISKNTFNWSTYRYGSEYTQLTKYCGKSEYGLNGYTDNLTTLEPEDDAATVHLGVGARTPTKEEWEELISNTTVDWIAQNGIYGRKFIAANGNSIFLPAAGRRKGMESDQADTGYYWTSSLYTEYPYGAFYFTFAEDNQKLLGHTRVSGLSVRSVRANQN